MEIGKAELMKLIEVSIMASNKTAHEYFYRAMKSEVGSADQKLYFEKLSKEKDYLGWLYEKKSLLNSVDEIEIIEVEKDDDDGLDTVLNWRD